MGKLSHGELDVSIDVDDRTLSHLHIVIARKFREGHDFFLSLPDDRANPIWMDHDVPLFITYSAPALSEIDPAWVDRVLRASEDAGHVVVVVDKP